MEISAMQGEEVAAPGGMASGAAGTGQEHGMKAAPVTAGSCTHKRGRVVIGLGVLAPDRGGGQMPGTEDPGAGEDVSAGAGNPGAASDRMDPDPAFVVYERDERIEERLNRKISRFEKRLEKIEERGRS